jgi:hypothetical protein
VRCGGGGLGDGDVKSAGAFGAFGRKDYRVDILEVFFVAGGFAFDGRSEGVWKSWRYVNNSFIYCSCV